MRRRGWWWGVLLLVAVPAAGFAQVAEERIGGRVVSERDGRAVVHATVSLTNLKGEKEAGQVVSDAEGRFRFEVVPPGKYRLTGAAQHYVSNSYMGHEGFGTAIVTGAGLATGDLTLQLVPGSAIYGRVLDDSGAAVERAQVTLYRENLTLLHPVRQVRNAQTDEDGEFEFAGLGEGRYFVSASGTPWYAVHAREEQQGQRFAYRAAVDPALDVAYAMVFYPNATDSSGAEALTLLGGDERTIDLRLHAEPARSLTVTMPVPEVGANGQRMQAFPQLMRKVFGEDQPMNLQSDYRNETTQMITGIPAGQYTLVEYVNGSGIPANSQLVDLSRGGVAVDVAKAVEAATVKVTFRAAGGELPKYLQVTLRNGDTNRAVNRGVASQGSDDKGNAEIVGVPVGEYSVSAAGEGRNLRVMAVSVDGKAVPDKRLRVVGSGTLAMEVTVSSVVAEVEGFVKRDGRGAAAAMVVLVPAGGDVDESLFRRDQSDLDGSFTMQNVVPGNYILVAIDDGWKLRWSDVAVMAPYLARGLPVTVKAEKGAMKLADAVVLQPR